MPRNGSGIYEVPSGSIAVPLTPITSAAFNGFTADMANIANEARAINVGGTGANTAAGALTNLGITATAAQINSGLFYTGATAPANPVEGSRWRDTSNAGSPVDRVYRLGAWVTELVDLGITATAAQINSGLFYTGATAPANPVEGSRWRDTAAAPVDKVYRLGAWVTEVSDLGLTAAATQLSGRNKLINGNFSINQRAVTGTVTLAAGAYGHDRFKAGASGCTYTFASAGGVTTITITAGSLVQAIEGLNLQTGQHVLSWDGTARGATRAEAVRNVAFGAAAVDSVTNWAATAVSNGLTATKVASGIDTDGLPYADYRWTGTATATSHDTVFNSGASTRNAATTGQVWSASAIFKLIAGTAAGTTGASIGVVTETAPTTYVTQGQSAATVAAVDTQRIGFVTVAGAANQVRTTLRLAVTNGAVIDVTYRIKGLALELGNNIRSAFQFSYAAGACFDPVTNGTAFALTGGVDGAVMFTPGTLSVPQLEAGALPTPFEHQAAALAQQQCDRYYQKEPAGQFQNVATGAVRVGGSWRTPFRATPTVVQAGTATIDVISAYQWSGVVNVSGNQSVNITSASAEL